MTISVALCTYNGARFVAQQLASIFDQTLKPQQIVVSDDGSTDGTVDVVRAFVAQHPSSSIEVTILPVDANRGVTANFQRAIEACSGDLIALCDQDDVWHPDRLAIAAREFEDSVLLTHADARLVDADGTSLGLTLFEALQISEPELTAIRQGDAFGAYLRRNLVTGATVMFRREVLNQATPFPQEWVHDEWLAIIAAAVGRVSVIDEQLIDYRQHGSNQIGVQRPTLRYRIGRMLEPRGDRNLRLAARAAVLAERLDELDASKHVRALAHDRARFDAVRAALPATRVARIPAVVRQWRAGSYRELSSQGDLDVLRDLLQPA